MEAPVTTPARYRKSERFDSIELTPIVEEDLQEEDSGRKSEMQVLLDGLASRIVESALGAASGGGAKTDLNDSKSVEKLVESLALGVVTSLLGLDSHQTSSSPSQLDSTVGSITDDTETDDSKESVTLLPSAGKISPKIKPKKPRPGSSEPIQKQISNSSISRKIREEDARKCEELTKMLQSTKTDFNADKRYMSPCEDNAQSHPHRVISSENGAWTAKLSRPRKTLRSPYQFSPYEKSPYPPRSKSGSRQRKGRRRADCAFFSDKKN
uniref:Uncharacterized protein n=1 Tax=Ciona savignyi TaxID=51511 RepID=H2YC46_CIOSA